MDFSYVHIRYFIGYVYHICLQDTIQSTLSLCLLCQAMFLPMPLRPLLLTTRSGFTPNLLYCCPTDYKGGPCHAPDCDGPSACMHQLKRTQKTKGGQEVKHQDHFLCTVTCTYCGKRRHYEDECHIKRCESEKLKKAEEERCKNAGKGGRPEGGGPNPGGLKGKGNPGGGEKVLRPPHWWKRSTQPDI